MPGQRRENSQNADTSDSEAQISKSNRATYPLNIPLKDRSNLSRIE